MARTTWAISWSIYANRINIRFDAEDTPSGSKPGKLDTQNLTCLDSKVCINRDYLEQVRNRVTTWPNTPIAAIISASLGYRR